MRKETYEEEGKNAAGERDAKRKCRTCTNWNMKNSPTMARAGLANCNLQVSRAVFYPPHHTCTQHKQITPVQAAARDKWLKGVGL